jgi:hypothetical protein
MWGEGAGARYAPLAEIQNIPERDLRCIFEAILVGDDFGAAMVAGLVEEAAECVDISTAIRVKCGKQQRDDAAVGINGTMRDSEQDRVRCILRSER